MSRQSSAISNDQAHEAEQGAIGGGAAPLVALRRQDSAQGARRFDSMTS
eukprot:COSAG05_NODE_11953_length_489_cov_0.797436_1_plen_48_part_10